MSFPGEEVYSEFLKERIRDARIALNKFPALKNLTGNFISLEENTRIYNVLFWKCAWADGEHPDNVSIAELEGLERYMKELDVLNWAQKKKNRIEAKLRSNTLSASMAGYTEISVAGYLAEKFGGTLVEYEPALASGGLSDIKLSGGRQPVYIEVTALNTGETERKFGEIFYQVGEYIWSQMRTATIAHIDIDTEVLPNNDEGIDVGSSVKMIISFLKTTNIVSLFDGELSIHGLKYLAQLGADKTLYDWKRILFHYSAELYDRSEIEPIHSFLKAVSGKQFINCPFASFWCTRSSENRVVEVQDQETSPSPAASMEREAFLNHVERKLREELNQMQPNEINLIVLRASNWAIVGYEKGKPEAVFFFPEFHKRIEQFMTKERNRDLTAVVVYENNFANAQIILNSSASSRSKTDYEFVERIAR